MNNEMSPGPALQFSVSESLNQIMLDKKYEVVIVGGGPAGSSAAIRLAGAGGRVLLVEQKKFPRAKLCGEFISPECLPHFARLGVLEELQAAGACEMAETVFYTRRGRSVSVPSAWFGGGPVAKLNGGMALGLSRAEMDERLLERARSVGVEVLEEAQAVGLLTNDLGRVEGVRLRMSDRRNHHSNIRWNDDPRTFAARALVTIDATGRSHALARYVERSRIANEKSHLKKTSLKKRAPLVAFKAHLENVRTGAGTCEIYFYHGGYGGLSPVESGRSNVCFIASAQDVRACGGDAWRVMREVVQTNERARFALAGARLGSEWLCVALESFGRRELVPADGLIAVGDAASFIDPFTGSGILMALESGQLAAETIARWLPKVRPEGADFAALRHLYRAKYDERFNGRLRLCRWLRWAAFAPPVVAETVILTLGASARGRRQLARATRQTSAITWDGP